MQARASRSLGSTADRRTNDRRRAAAAAMLGGLIDEAVARFDAEPLGERDADRLAAWLGAHQRGLVEALGRRADEHLFAGRLRLRARQAADLTHDFVVVDPLDGWASEGGDIGAAAQTYLRAEAASLDEFGEVQLALDELTSQDRERIGWAVAALLRPTEAIDRPAHDVDARRIVAAMIAARPLAALDHAAEELAGALAAAAVSPWVGGEALAWGHATIGGHLLARLIGIEPDVVCDLLQHGAPAEIAALARAIGGEDMSAVAGLLMTIAYGRCDGADAAGATAAAWLDIAERFAVEEARGRVALLALPAPYREALAGLERLS